MRIRLTTSRATVASIRYAGDEIDLPAEEAAQLVAAGQAEVIEDRVIETAAINHRSRERRRQPSMR